MSKPNTTESRRPLPDAMSDCPDSEALRSSLSLPDTKDLMIQLLMIRQQLTDLQERLESAPSEPKTNRYL